MPNAQAYFNERYWCRRGSETWLYESYQELYGSLSLTGFTALRNLVLDSNNLTSIDISGCPNLIELTLHNNNLTSLDFSHNSRLEEIYITRNNITADLRIFSHLVKLRVLNIAGEGCYHRSGDGRHNTFSGSLASLRNCQFLEELFIVNQTLIQEGLEELPTSHLKNFSCKGTVFFAELEPLNFNVETWKAKWAIQKAEEIVEEERIIHKDAMKIMNEWYQGTIDGLRMQIDIITGKLKQNEIVVEEELEKLKGILEVMREERENHFNEIDPILARIKKIVDEWGSFFKGEINQKEKELAGVKRQLEVEKKIARRARQEWGQANEKAAQLEKELFLKDVKGVMVGVGLGGALFLIGGFYWIINKLFSSPLEVLAKKRQEAAKKKKQWWWKGLEFSYALGGN